MRSLRIIVTFFFGFALTGLIMILTHTGVDEDPQSQSNAMVADPSIPSPTTPTQPVQNQWVTHEIKSGQTLGTILPEYDVPTQLVLDAAMPFHDLSSIRAGQTLSFLIDAATHTATSMTYALDEDRTLVVTKVPSTDNTSPDASWTAKVDTIEYESKVGVMKFAVRETLWEAATNAGLRASDIATLASVFEFDVDFNTEIRAGATVQMIVEELWNDGRRAKYGRPLFVRFQNNNNDYTAIRHENSEGRSTYYDLEGVARKKAFLRSPLRFSRVTSGFSLKRFHPVLKKRRPHYGVDYGAPTGTPVRAVGSGVITMAGTNGGHGRFVKIDHPGPYDSSYSHLSRIKVRKGQKIQQGDVIGTVGSSGLATGPHLHFQFWVKGKYVNPQTLDLPRTETVPSTERATFDQNRDNWAAILGQTKEENAVADAQL